MSSNNVMITTMVGSYLHWQLTKQLNVLYCVLCCIINYMLLEIKQYCYNTTTRGSVKMSYQKLWLLFLPILLVNGLFTRSCCLIPYQIFLCVHTVTISSISDKTRVTRATVRGQYGNDKADIHCVIYLE